MAEASTLSRIAAAAWDYERRPDLRAFSSNAVAMEPKRVRQYQTGVCATCGGPTSMKRITRCRECWSREKRERK
jgi:hypothetical protein